MELEKNNQSIFGRITGTIKSFTGNKVMEIEEVRPLLKELTT